MNELITLERNEPLNFTVTSTSIENITAVQFTPPNNVQLNITFVPTELFVIFPNLKKLELRAKIETVNANDFRNAQNLEQLTLNNQLQRIPARIFSLAKKLNNLVLSRNRIDTIEDFAFDGLDNLEQLGLAKNQLTSLKRYTFAGLTKLVNLNLRDNDISTIEDGAFSLPKLDELYLSKNRLKTLSDRIFDGTPLLRNINLDNNNLQQFGTSFYGLKNAARLVIYLNEIHDIDIIALANMPELTTLWMRESGFSFGNKSLDQFQFNNTKVTFLDISANHLSDPNDFQRIAVFRQLKTLNLDGNDYVELNLLNRTMRQYFPDLENIHLSQNKWNCDWFRPVLEQLISDHIRPVSTECA